MIPLLAFILLSLTATSAGNDPATDSARLLAEDTAVVAATALAPAALHPLAAFGLTLYRGLRTGVRWLRGVLRPVTDALARVAQRLFKDTPAKDQIIRLPLTKRHD